MCARMADILRFQRIRHILQYFLVITRNLRSVTLYTVIIKTYFIGSVEPVAKLFVTIIIRI